jgi:hypothetical protein
VDNTNELQNLIEEAQIAVSDIEGFDAKKILKKIEAIVSGGDASRFDSDFYQQLDRLMTSLKIVAFPNLTDEESADVLRYHFLESFDIDVPIENLLSAKLFIVPYLMRDELREKLKRALLGNNQRLGELTVGQWISEFEKNPNVHDDSSSAVNFVMQNSNAQKLNPLEKKKLKEILHIYDYYLVATIPATGTMLNEILASLPETKKPAREEQFSYAPVRPREAGHPMPEEATRRSAQHPGAYRSAAASAPINLAFDEALQKYQNLGEQLISSNPVKLKFLPQPVRPSIKNWITDYHEALGAGRHETMDRGNYLYHSENTKRLTPGERQKLATVLKALDENLQIMVNPGKQEILLGNQELGIRNYESDKKEPGMSYEPEIMKRGPSRIGSQAVSQEPPRTFIKQEPRYVPPKPQSWPAEKSAFEPRPASQPFSVPSASTAPESAGRIVSSPSYKVPQGDVFPAEKKPAALDNKKMSFSSPQQLPSEKSDSRSHWRISPIGGNYREDAALESKPRVEGNIVDLSGLDQ